ncbi:hypothetical protein ABT117_04460 [Streptomyces sp. NPDC002262]|uniref:hypothetical protein n=1 Tax=Streptomyces sp. NPDC002262 TaxID=3154414 RepID=UPI00332658FB
MIERLPADVSDVLALVLAGDDPVRVALRAQVPHLRVTGRCGCGCGTAYFGLDAGEVEPAPTRPGRGVAAEALLYTEDGECPGEVLVFTDDGCLSWLEVCSWSDEVEVDLAAARRWLRAGRTAPDPSPPRP